MDSPKNLGTFKTLVDIVAKLRSKEGCPWDREQTHTSLREHLLEESYEVLEAIDREDWPELSVELGDLLLQIVLHAQIASEAGEFELADVLTSINKKLIH
ncbi:MAG: MazG nucleotide pyrophosphohydrolase domain-containing protein, partial [Dehalococcoidales bacterium]|nr:MazG nucleotide pyrophosphohydrolase domain-containing protein [Dehalococcoidales bacterium]